VDERTRGQATDIDLHAKEILRMRTTINNILSKHSGQPLSASKRMWSAITS